MPLQQSLFHVFSQILIEEYRKDHPGASAREVVQSCPNWQPVLQSIKEIFNQYTPAPEARDVVSNPTHFTHQISVDEEARYRTCLVSVKSSTCMIQTMSLLPSETRDMDDINRFLKTLRGQERTCAGICADQTCTKQDLLELVQLQIQASLTPQVHQFLLRFLQNVQSQMTSQYEIYRCEVEIGNRFIRSLREAVLFLSYQEHVDYHSKFLKILSKLYRVLKKVRLDTLPSIPQENFQTIDQALEKYESHIQQRRDQYQAIQKAVKRLQSITRYVETLDPNSIQNQKPAASRMAFIQKHHKI